MSVKKKKFSPLTKVGIAVAVLAVAGGAFLVVKHFSSSNGSEPTDAEKKVIQEKEGVEAAREVKAPNTVPDADKPTATNDITISSVSQQNDQVVVQTKLTSVPSGSCTLSLTKSGYSLTKQAQVIYQADFSTCAGFAVPRSEFSVSGEWTLKLSVAYSGKTYESAVKTFNVQ